MIIQTHIPTRTRNQDGRFRQKRGDTHLSTLKDRYGEISDRRGDTHLATLRQLRAQSLSKMVKARPEVSHAPGLNDRQRNQNGRLRSKRSDTLVKTLRETYGDGFAPGFPGSWTLGLVRRSTGQSLSQLVG